MDPLLRGLCERQIDEKLLECDIQEMRDVIDILDLPVSSKDDASLGLFLGVIYNVLDTECLRVYGRRPSREEMSDFYLLLRRRACEIMDAMNVSRRIPESGREEGGDFESILDLEEDVLPDIEVDWGAASRRRSKREIMGIPLPV